MEFHSKTFFVKKYLLYVKFVLHLVNQTLHNMKTRFLFPYWFRYLGIACFLVHIPIMLFFKKYHDMDNPQPGLFSGSHVFFIFTTLMVTIGLFLFAFSKEKIEDEQIMQLRRDSLQWAVYF